MIAVDLLLVILFRIGLSLTEFFDQIHHGFKSGSHLFSGVRGLRFVVNIILVLTIINGVFKDVLFGGFVRVGGGAFGGDQLLVIRLRLVAFIRLIIKFCRLLLARPVGHHIDVQVIKSGIGLHPQTAWLRRFNLGMLAAAMVQ